MSHPILLHGSHDAKATKRKRIVIRTAAFELFPRSTHKRINQRKIINSDGHFRRDEHLDVFPPPTFHNNHTLEVSE